MVETYTIRNVKFMENTRFFVEVVIESRCISILVPHEVIVDSPWVMRRGYLGDITVKKWWARQEGLLGDA